MQPTEPNHYATLGLDRHCTSEQIRTAYRLLAKRFHPDVNPDVHGAMIQTQVLNAAYEVLGDPVRREAYDDQLAHQEKLVRARTSKLERNITQDVHVRIDELIRGATRSLSINDPGNPTGMEKYELVIPPESAVGMRLRLPREGGGFVVLRLRPLPHFQFKVRGSDLRCDLKISSKRAAQGGEEMITGVLGNRIRVRIPSRVARGETIRIAGEGLPKPRGGRGDLLVRIVYRPEVRISRAS